MISSEIIGMISAVINLVSIIPYVYAVVKGTARPSRVTWLIWSFLSWVLLIASIQSGAQATSFWLASAVFNSTLIALLSFWKGQWTRDALDIGCFILGILGVILWIATSRAAISVYIGSLIDLVAIIPTVRKVWGDPSSEPKIAWTMGGIGALLNMLAIDSFKLVILIPPVTVMIWHMLVLIPIYLGKKIRSI